MGGIDLSAASSRMIEMSTTKRDSLIPKITFLV